MKLDEFHNRIQERIKALRVTTGSARDLDVFCNISLACRSNDRGFVANRIGNIKAKNMYVWNHGVITDLEEYRKFCEPLMEIEALFEEVDVLECKREGDADGETRK